MQKRFSNTVFDADRPADIDKTGVQKA